MVLLITFLPYKSFYKSAMVLDKKRCFKQVVETAQILDVLEGRKTGWKNHPAVKMWEGHIPELKEYFNCFLYQAKWVHGIKTKYELFNAWEDFINPNHPRDVIHDSVVLKMPWWLGNKDFHRAMRARLIEKDPDFYLKKFKKKDINFNNGKYFWPVMETKKFRVI